MNYSNVNSGISYGITENGYGFDTYQEFKPKNKKRSKFNNPLNYVNRGLAEQTNKEGDDLTQIFFSAENMKRIQKLMRKEITMRTKGEFRLDVDQDETKLLIVMKSVYNEHARFLPDKVVRQVKALNKKVIDYIAPDMVTEIKQEYGYIKEINEPLKPMMRPVNVNSAGRNVLPSLTSVWGF
jgi:hypothetical protein